MRDNMSSNDIFGSPGSSHTWSWIQLWTSQSHQLICPPAASLYDKAILNQDPVTYNHMIPNIHSHGKLECSFLLTNNSTGC